jgi:6-phosphogluconolactonase
MLNLRVFDTKDDLFETAASAVIETIRRNDRAVIALSGGSTPRGLYHLLASPAWQSEMEGTKALWVTGDERCVPPDHADSNARMIQSSLFAGGVLPGHEFLRFRTEQGEPSAIAATFVDEWRQLGIEGIDLAILGVGDDGHTASLFPGTGAVDVTDRLATEVYVERLDSWRVTLTAPVLRDAASKLVLAVGESKRPVIEALQRGETFPVSAVIDTGGPAWWLVDRNAWPGSGIDSER